MTLVVGCVCVSSSPHAQCNVTLTTFSADNLFLFVALSHRVSVWKMSGILDWIPWERKRKIRVLCALGALLCCLQDSAAVRGGFLTSWCFSIRYKTYSHQNIIKLASFELEQVAFRSGTYYNHLFWTTDIFIHHYYVPLSLSRRCPNLHRGASLCGTETGGQRDPALQRLALPCQHQLASERQRAANWGRWRAGSAGAARFALHPLPY